MISSDFARMPGSDTCFPTVFSMDEDTLFCYTIRKEAQ